MPHLFGLNKATIRTIEKMRVPFDISNFWVSTSKTTAYSRNSTLEKTEKHMVLWIEVYRKKISIHGKIIEEKALRIYNRLQEFESSVYHQGTNKMAFNTSHGQVF